MQVHKVAGRRRAGEQVTSPMPHRAGRDKLELDLRRCRRGNPWFPSPETAGRPASWVCPSLVRILYNTRPGASCHNCTWPRAGHFADHAHGQRPGPRRGGRRFPPGSRSPCPSRPAAAAIRGRKRSCGFPRPAMSPILVADQRHGQVQQIGDQHGPTSPGCAGGCRARLPRGVPRP